MGDRTLGDRVLGLEEGFALLSLRLDSLTTGEIRAARVRGEVVKREPDRKRGRLRVKAGFKRPMKIDVDNLPRGVSLL